MAHLSPMCQGQSAPKPYAAFPLPQYIKSDQDWQTGFRDIQVKMCEIFAIQGQVTLKMSGLIRPKIELDRPFMPVLVTSNFDDDSIKNERASRRHHFPL